jgi:hypothetical protein
MESTFKLSIIQCIQGKSDAIKIGNKKLNLLLAEQGGAAFASQSPNKAGNKIILVFVKCVVPTPTFWRVCIEARHVRGDLALGIIYPVSSTMVYITYIIALGHCLR